MTDSVRVSVRGKGATAEEEALVETAEDGRLSEMQRLLSEGVHVNAVNKRTRADVYFYSRIYFCTVGTTALVRAATRNHTDCVDVLLKSGADVNAADRPPPHISDSYNGGWTALHHASYWGHVQVVQMLRDAAGSRLDESRRNDAGKTAADLVLEQALRAAAMADDEHEVSRLVVVLGVDPGAPDVKEGETPLLLAAAVHSWDSDRVSPALQLLLSKADQATIDHQDKWGRCALHVAVAQGKCGAVKALLQAGANPLLKDNAGKTPLEVAVAKKQWRCRNVLLTFKYKGHSLQEREEEREEEQQQQHKEEEEAKTPPQRRPVPAPEQHTKPSFTLLDRVDDLERQLKEVGDL